MFSINKDVLKRFPSNRVAMMMQLNHIHQNRKNYGEFAQAEKWFNHLNTPEMAAQFSSLEGNAGQKPFDLYREFDSTITEQFRLDEGSLLLQRLMPLSRSVDIGRMVLENARSSGIGGFQTTLAGENFTKFDNPDYDTQGTLIPFHDNGFKRNWREYDQLTLEQFQDVMIGQEEAARTHRIGLVDYILDGTELIYKGASWDGFRNDGRVEQVDLSSDPRVTFDFTDTNQTGSAIRKAFKALVDILRLENKVSAPATYFVSNEILSNLENYFGLNGANDIQTTDTSLKSITGVADIVGTSALVGNQILAFPEDPRFVQPVVALPMSTRMKQRNDMRDPYCWMVESAMGINVKNDFEGVNKGALYAAS